MRALLLPLLLAAPAAADPPGVSARFAIDGAQQLRGQFEGQAGPVAGGLIGGTLAAPDQIGDLTVYVGIRPPMPRAHVELRLTRPLDDAGPALLLDVDRPLGRKVSVGAEVGARQTGDDATGNLRLTATRRIGRGALDVALSGAEGASPRAALAMLLPF